MKLHILPISQAIDGAAPERLAPVLQCNKLFSRHNSERLELKNCLNKATENQMQLSDLRPSAYRTTVPSTMA